MVIRSLTKLWAIKVVEPTPVCPSTITVTSDLWDRGREKRVYNAEEWTWS